MCIMPLCRYNFTDKVFRTFKENFASLDCKWLFRSADTTLKLIFRVTVQVACGDVLLAFDGTTMDDRRIGEPFCSAHTTPSESRFYVTSSNQMLLSFITDTTPNAQLEKGFKVEILSARPVAYEAEACNSNIKTLVATKDEEVLTSPSFPDNYKNNTNCYWNITSPTGAGTIRINVLFLDTDVDSLGVCYDNITTYDGEERKMLCDTKSLIPKSLLFNSSFVQIVFYSDYRDEKRGFLLRYSFLGEAATSASSTSATKITTEISTTEATTITSIAETTTMSISETTMSTTETTTMSTAESTTKSTSETTAKSTAESTTKSTTETTTMSTAESTTKSTTETTTMSTAESTTKSTSETTAKSTAESTTKSTSKTTAISTAESTTTMSTSETAVSTSETTRMSTSETTIGTITTETTILETTHSITLSSGYPIAGTTQKRTLLLTPEAVIFLVVWLIVTLVFVIIACVVFGFAKNKKRKRSTDSSCSSAPPLWRRHFIEVDSYTE